MPPSPKSVKDPCDAVRDGLIWGRWKSGERLKPQHLKEELGCTSAALREAFLRLAGEGFVAVVKHRGFRVVEHSEETFRQVAHLRLVLETEGVELALKYGDFDWEMALNAANYNLEYIENRMAEADDASLFVKRWSRQDWHFHSTLMSACWSDTLMQVYRSVYDTFRMYAVSQISGFGFSEVTREEHRAICDAAIVRDLPACHVAVRTHLVHYENNNRQLKRLAPKGA